MTNGWTFEPLGSICDILDHLRKPVTKRDRTAGDYPYYGATGVLDHVSAYLFDEPLVLVGEDGAKWECGDQTAFAISGKCWVNNHAHVLRPHRTRLLDNWLIHFLNHSDLSEYVTGLTVPKLNQGSLRGIPVPLPQLAEQRRIVRILDEASAGIATAKANTEQTLRNAHALFDSQLDTVFTERGKAWTAVPLEKLVDSTMIGLVRNAKQQGDNLAYDYVKMNNISNDNSFAPTRMVRINANDGEVKRFQLLDGDLLFNTRNSHELVGKSCVYRSVGQRPVLFNNNIMRLRFTSQVASTFAGFAFSSQPVAQQLRSMVSGTTNVAGIYYKDLKNLMIPIPPRRDEQDAIASMLGTLRDETQKLETICERKRTALGALKKSLLHRAFAGEL